LLENRAKAGSQPMLRQIVVTWLPRLAILVALPLGIVVSLASQRFAGSEILLLLAALGLLSVLALSAVKFDFMVFVAFCLFSLVRVEPAPSDVLFMLLLAVGLASGRLSLYTTRDAPNIHFALWVFLSANLFSAIGVIPVFHSIRFLMITVYMIALFYFVKMYITSFQAMRNLVLGYLVSTIIAISLVGLGYLGVGPSAELFIFWGFRAVGFFKDPNVFGPFLVPMVILLVDEILKPRFFPRLSWLKFLGVTALSAGVLASFSRGAWANLAVSFLTYSLLTILALRGKNRTRSVRVLLLLFLGSLLLMGAFIFWKDLQGSLVSRSTFQVYDARRISRQLSGIEVALSHLSGVGPGIWVHAHSLYVRTLAEHGILGLSALLLFLFVLLKNTFRAALQEIDKRHGLSAKVLTASLTGLIVNSVVVDTIHWRHFWLILGISWVVSTAEAATPPVTSHEGPSELQQAEPVSNLHSRPGSEQSLVEKVAGQGG
jgi:hypothetical protein